MSKHRRAMPLGRSASRLSAGVDADARPHRVARQVIRSAAEDLIDRLGDLPSPDPRRPDCSESDQHAVHQVRVATRRLGAALAAFAPMLPDKRLRRLARAARRVRRAGAEVRELDILLRQIERVWKQPAEPAGAPQTSEAVAARVRELLTARRGEARLRFARAGSRRGTDRLQRRTDRACAALSAFEDADTLHDAAGLLMSPIVRAFEDRLPPAMPTIDQLHALRLAVKKARYAVELLQPALETQRCVAAHERLVELQERLGDLNDLHRGAELLRTVMVDEFAMRWSPGCGAHTPAQDRFDATDVAALLEFERLSNMLRQAALAQAALFTEWWNGATADWIMLPLRNLCGSEPARPDAVPDHASAPDALGPSLEVVIAASRKAARNGSPARAETGAREQSGGFEPATPSGSAAR